MAADPLGWSFGQNHRHAAGYVDKILLAAGLSYRELSEANRAKIHSTAPRLSLGDSRWLTVA